MSPRQRRDLSEAELTAIEDRLIAAAPPDLTDDEFQRYFEPRMEQALADLEYTAAPVEGTAGQRLRANLWEAVNPMTIASGMYQTVRHPINTAAGLARMHGQQFTQGLEAASRPSPTVGGRLTNAAEAVGHFAASALPVMGPVAAQIGEQAGAGDIAGAAGQTAGLLGPSFVAPGVQAARAGLTRYAPQTTARLTSALEEGAAGLFTNVMRPELGANKQRFGALAEKVAPALSKIPGMGKWTREGLHQQVGVRLADAEAALDAANNARLHAQTFNTQPLVAALKAKRAELTAEPVTGSRIGYQPISVKGQHATTWITPQGPIGTPVVPGPNAGRVAMIDQAISELEQLGPHARYEPLRRIREAYDKPAKVKYAPSITQDFLAKTGEASGAADVTGVLREHLAKFDPHTAAANVDYSLFKTADDVLQATADIQRSRPTVANRILHRIATMTGGAAVGGTAGAGVGYLLAPVLDVVSNSGVTTKLKTARTLQRLSHFIRTGDESGALAMINQLQRMGPAIGAAERYRQEQEKRQPAAEQQGGGPGDLYLTMRSGGR